MSHGNEVLPQDTTHLTHRPRYQRESLCQDPAVNRITRRAPDHRKETQTEVVWTCLPFMSGQNHPAVLMQKDDNDYLQLNDFASCMAMST